MDKQVFIRNLDTIKRRKVLLIRVGMSLLFITLCTAMWLTKTTITPRGMLTFKMVAIAVFGALAYAFVAMIQRLARRLDMYCPNCGRNLSGPLSHKVLANDQCFQCGMRLFS